MGNKRNQNGGGRRKAWSQTELDLLLDLYMRGLTQVEIGKQLKITRQRVYQLIRKYKFLPQSRYMLEGALARAWMLRHQPAEFRRIAGKAAEQSSQAVE